MRPRGDDSPAGPCHNSRAGRILWQAMPERPHAAHSPARLRYRIGLDIGGTFTDFILFDGETGAVRLHKCLTTPHDPARGINRGATAAEQVRNALAAIGETLRSAGSSLDRVVQVTMLITDPADYDACNAEYVKHFPHGLPARHTARFGVPTEAKVAFACIALAGDAP